MQHGRHRDPGASEAASTHYMRFMGVSYRRTASSTWLLLYLYCTSTMVGKTD
jgi:hypothetical protein